MYKITEIKKKRKESKDEVNSLKMPKHLPTPANSQRQQGMATLDLAYSMPAVTGPGFLKQGA